MTLGSLGNLKVSIVHTENRHGIRIISFRKASKKERHILRDAE
ncbi:hypothetical protein GJ699_03020 [Duganella sp. FT80W]|uniref:BrnT family toxin n=1 Tax=Duganella guangzhouensis TaxID=2666084 RepID=A0A6I2KT36_9BURK|nr:hypothetical protein [Duganella guangzhouensis]